jgi:phage N-6-adenine-methyltransferase
MPEQLPVSLRAKSGSVIKFNPKQTLMKVGALKGAIDTARKIEDWEALNKAIDELIAEQPSFVAWWDDKVGPGQGPGRGKTVTKTGLFSVTKATAQTGVTKQQVSIWRGRLKDEDEYHEFLHDAAQAAAWARGRKPPRTFYTGNDEWFTPTQPLDLARAVLGEIKLDPATHPVAQRRVRAAKFFTKAEDGLNKEWCGSVFLNPPYSTPLIGQFVTKLVEEYTAGRVTAAIMLTHNNTDTEWFHSAARTAEAICFTRGRINFHNAADSQEPGAALQGQSFFYFGSDPQLFARVFSTIGLIVHPAAE